MNTITVVQFTAEERQPFKAVENSLTIAYPDQSRNEPEPRAVNALASKGQDITYELLVKAKIALTKQALICDRERHVEHWTTTLSTGDPITPDTPGDGLVTNPYFMCETLATARQQQYQEAREAIAIVEQAMCIATPRPADPKYVDV